MAEVTKLLLEDLITVNVKVLALFCLFQFGYLLQVRVNLGLQFLQCLDIASVLRLLFAHW